MKQSSLDKWEDLDALENDEIRSMAEQKKNEINYLENEIRTLRSERKDQVHIVKSLRSALSGVEASNSGRKNLLNKFHISRKNAQVQREKRDLTNKLIPPPSKILEEWLSDTYNGLTTIDNDLTLVPMLRSELSSFGRFFEIQVSITRKREAEKAHSIYLENVSEMRKISAKLDENKKEAQNKVTELKDSADIDGDKISRKEIKKISKRISQIDKRLDRIKIKVKEVKKEVRRIESYSKISSGRSVRIKISDIRGIAAKGGALNAEEMGALLESGGISSIKEVGGNERNEGSNNRKVRKKGRKLSVSRRGSRKGNIATRRD